jgi:hypothetical protein
MAILFSGLAGLFGMGGGAAAGTAAATTGAAATTAASGISLSTILQGTASVLGLVASIGAGAAEADMLEAQAIDAEREKPLETLQGISRRQSIRRQMADAIGAQDVAYAASGVDLSFGTARAARRDAFREADTALAVDMGNEETRISRLSERAASYRRAAKTARRMGFINGLLGFADSASSMVGRY